MGGRGLEGAQRRKVSISYPQVLLGSKQVQVEKLPPDLVFSSLVEVEQRLSRSLIGKVVVTGSIYNIQTTLEMRGFYAIKATTIGETGVC